ncbi:MAG TPA: hypothetical protein VE782_02685, partial [Myxococcaceae bacterium]|nr:hypothetical protein [Myxococcaceae bacterium]
MNDGDFIRMRLAEWSEELGALEATLDAGAEVFLEEAELAGRALEVCGHLLRRTARSDFAPRSIERVLKAVPSGGIEAWAESVDMTAVESRLWRAADEAVEAGLPETPGEAETWAAWARQGLEMRDAFESRLVAMRFREGLGHEAERAVRERLAAA